MKRWNPRIDPTKREQFILKRLQRTRKLFAFLRLRRHEIFDDAFQAELESLYRRTGAGEEPLPPAFLCMVILVQAYLGTSDAEAVELALMDARWAMVLDCLGAEEPPFSQGALQSFRERLIAGDMDRRLVERTIELAKKTKEFDWRKLPKDLRVAIDSRPFEGAGRVEDTFNLLGHAARVLVKLAAEILEVSVEQVCRDARIPLLLHSSVKAGLDINWSDPEQKDRALDVLMEQVKSLDDWLERRQLLQAEPLRPYIDAIAQVQKQDVEQGDDGRFRIRHGVAEDRRVSIEDAEMRHGRKSKSKRFNGYKQHIATDLDSGLILGCAVEPANRPRAMAVMDLDHNPFMGPPFFPLASMTRSSRPRAPDTWAAPRLGLLEADRVDDVLDPGVDREGLDPPLGGRAGVRDRLRLDEQQLAADVDDPDPDGVARHGLQPERA